MEDGGLVDGAATATVLEKLNLLIDIAIDEERYADAKAWVAVLAADGDAVGDPESLPELNAALEQARSVQVVHPVLEATLSLEGESSGWALLLVVKRMRAHIQSRVNEMPGGLNRLSEYLVGRLVQPPEFLTGEALAAVPPGVRDSYETQKTLNLLHLNEVGACYKHDLSVGFANQTIRQINEAARSETGQTRNGWNIYELVALLNEGLGYAHAHRHSDALSALEEVVRAFEEWEDQNYIAADDDPYLSGRLANPDQEELTSLWRVYAFAPALVYRAEVLGDLNRSTEQLPGLARLATIESDYWRKRGVLLEALARLDGNLWDGTVNPEIKGIDEIRGWLEQEDHLGGRLSLEQKCHQVLLRYGLERIRRACQVKNAAGTALVPFPVDDARQLHGLFEEFEQTSFPLGDVERKDAALLWIDFYETFVSLKRQFLQSGFLGEQDYAKLSAVAEYFTSSEWFPDQDSRGRLLEVLRDVNPEGEHAGLSDVEARVLNHLIRQRDCPKWRLTKAVRRLEILNRECENAPLSAAFRLPIEEEAQSIVEGARAVFCTPECPGLAPHEGEEGCAEPEGVWTTCRAATFQAVLETNKESFVDQLIYRSRQPVAQSYCLTVLRRWQSFTPALSTGITNDSRGGGYFVYKTDKHGFIDEGIVVDPGFDFVENFLREGFSIRDVSAVVMTHAHVDHTADFQPLVTLVAEYNKNRFSHGAPPKPEKRILALMSDGCFDKYQEAIEDSRLFFRDVVVMNRGLSQEGLEGFQDWPGHLRQLEWFRIEPVLAVHSDLTSGDSVGVVIADKDGTPLLGFTGDTSWWPGLAEQFHGVPTLCANLGGIVPVGKAEATIAGDLLHSTRARRLVAAENHLYWPGFSLLTTSLPADARLVVVSELCEELKGGLRTDLASQLNEAAGNDLRFLPEDLGLTVQLATEPRVHCFACDRTIAPERVLTLSFGRDEATYYVCDACYAYRKQAVDEGVAEYHENGWPLEIDRHA